MEFEGMRMVVRVSHEPGAGGGRGLKVLLIGEADVLSLCKMPECIDAMRGAFVSLDRGVVSDPLRTRIAVAAGPEHTGDAVDGEGPGHADQPQGREHLSGHRRREAAVNADGAPVDGSDGQVRAVMDGTSLTALRTGAVSGLSCTYLARRDSKVLGMIGAGGQSFQQVNGVVSGPEHRHGPRLLEDAGEEQGAGEEVRGGARSPRRAVGDVKECVSGCDVIVTATNSKTRSSTGQSCRRART